MDLTRIKRLVKEVSWIAIGQIVAVAGALVLVRVLTEYLEPAEYGQLALGLTLAGLVNQVVMGGMTAGIGRFYPLAVGRHDLNGYLHASHRLVGYATAVVAIMAMALVVGFSWSGYSQWIGLAVATLIFSVLSGYNAVLSSIQNAARQRAVVAFHGGADAWLKILLAIGVMLLMGSTGTAVVIGYALSSLLVTGSQLFFLRRTIRPQDTLAQKNENWMRQIWGYSWPFSIFGIFTWMQLVSDRWALQAFAPPHEIGLYAVVFQLGYTPIGLATGLMLSFLGPILYQRSGNAANHERNSTVHRLVWRIASAGLFFTTCAFVLTLALHEWIFHLLVSANYYSVSYLLPWVVLAGGLFAVGQMLTLKLLSEMRPASMTFAKIGTGVLGVGLNILGAEKYGLQGVVAALVAFSGIYFLWMAWLAKYLPAKINYPTNKF